MCVCWFFVIACIPTPSSPNLLQPCHQTSQLLTAFLGESWTPPVRCSPHSEHPPIIENIKNNNTEFGEHIACANEGVDTGRNANILENINFAGRIWGFVNTQHSLKKCGVKYVKYYLCNNFFSGEKNGFKSIVKYTTPKTFSL